MMLVAQILSEGYFMQIEPSTTGGFINDLVKIIRLVFGANCRPDGNSANKSKFIMQSRSLNPPRIFETFLVVRNIFLAVLRRAFKWTVV